MAVLGAGCGMRSAVEANVGGDEAESSSPALPACGAGVTPCDPNDVGGRTCEDLAMGTGPVICDPDDCTYDTSLCVPTSEDMTSDGTMAPMGGTGMDMSMDVPQGGTSGAASGTGGEESNALLDLIEILFGEGAAAEPEEGDAPEPEDEDSDPEPEDSDPEPEEGDAPEPEDDALQPDAGAAPPSPPPPATGTDVADAGAGVSE